jgi:hypothetical protein
MDEGTFDSYLNGRSKEIRDEMKTVGRKGNNAQASGESPNPASGSGKTESNKVDYKGLSRGEKYSLDREMRKQDFFNNNSANLTEESVKSKLMKDFDLDDTGYDKFTKNTDDYRDNLFNERRGNAVKNVNVMDHMMGNKVPHMAGGALLTAGLVNSMSSSKGQQSNSALYGQSQPYY